MSFTAVVGIDPSLTSTGVARCELVDTRQFSPRDWVPLARPRIGTTRVRSKAPASASWDERGERIDKLAAAVLAEVPRGALVVIESPAYSSNTGHVHDRSGYWWTLWRGCADLGCRILPVTPNQRAKYATGSGAGPNASKDMVLAATIKRYPTLEVTGNDVADAVLLMAIGMRLYGMPLEESMPVACLDALTKITL